MRSLIPVCNLPNVFAFNSLAANLAQQFCACPAAHSILEASQQTEHIFFNVGNFAWPSINTERTDILTSHTIKIPKKHIKSKDALAGLAFEVFNAKKSAKQSETLKLAQAGALGMDSFAREIELNEPLFSNDYLSLLKTCSQDWNYEPKNSEYIEALEIQAKLELSDKLLLQEIECHTDKIRERWIKQFKPFYCPKHPEDERSCNTQIKDLCDHHKFSTESQAMEIKIKRLCHFIPQGSKELKERFAGMLKNVCPEVLQKVLPHSDL